MTDSYGAVHYHKLRYTVRQLLLFMPTVPESWRDIQGRSTDHAGLHCKWPGRSFAHQEPRPSPRNGEGKSFSNFIQKHSLINKELIETMKICSLY